MTTQPGTSFFAVFIGFSALTVALTLSAQEKPDRPPWAQPGGSGQAKSADSQSKDKQNNQDQTSHRGTIKVNTDLVNVLVSVLDEHNRPAPNLPVDAFQIFEEGFQQKIDVFEQETKLPVDLNLMIDAS